MAHLRGGVSSKGREFPAGMSSWPPFAETPPAVRPSGHRDKWGDVRPDVSLRGDLGDVAFVPMDQAHAHAVMRLVGTEVLASNGAKFDFLVMEQLID